MNRLQLAIRYASGSRLQEYQKILMAALQNEYQVCSVERSLEAIDQECEQLLVLRHDVDQHSPGVIDLASIEAKIGVTSTYYFRKSTLDMAHVDHVKKLGHEVSFHYETIADYALEHGIADRCTIESKHLEACVELLSQELKWFRTLVDAPCRTVASHGAPLNRELDLPNRVLFDVFDDLRDRLGVVVEAYDSDYLGEFDCYISDTQMEINNGFRYNDHPLRAISDRVPRILMLTHPNHWSFGLRTRFRRIVKCLVLGQREDLTEFAEASRLRRGRART